MEEFLKELYDYNNHYNQKLAETIVGNPEQISERTRSLFNHLVNAHQIWIARIRLKVNSIAPWDIRSDRKLKHIDDVNYRDTLLIMEQLNLEESVQYSNSQGQIFHNKILDILFHIINHSTYHRGQIAADMRRSGVEPINSDYIFYKR